MNKIIKVTIYYVGLIAGVIIANYMLNCYIEYADSFMKTFQEMDKLNLIHGRELFLYLFLKRLKQILFFFFLFVQVSKVITLVFSELYFSMIEGLFLSLCTYYYGINGIFGAFLLLLPQFGIFLLIQYTGWKMYNSNQEKKRIDFTKSVIVIIVVTIVLTLAELAVNYLAEWGIFIHK